MKPNLSTLSKGIVYMMGIAIIIINTILLPELAREEAVGKINPPSALPYLLGAWIVSIPIFIALFQTISFITDINNNTAFSSRTVSLLENIKNSFIIFSVLIVIGAISIIVMGMNVGEDVTPVFTMSFIIIFMTCIITTFVAVIKKLLQDAITIKSEQDLTI